MIFIHSVYKIGLKKFIFCRTSTSCFINGPYNIQSIDTVELLYYDHRGRAEIGRNSGVVVIVKTVTNIQKRLKVCLGIFLNGRDCEEPSKRSGC